MTDLLQAAADYLALRRAVGFKLRGHDRLLLDFVGYVGRADSSRVTSELALAWATQPTTVQPVR